MKPDFYLILPDIRSCHNVGAMFRTADACGVSKIYLVGYTPHPPRKEIAKVALGAEHAVPWEGRKQLKTLVQSLKKQGIQIVALEKTAASSSLSAARFTSPLALIVGNEVEGIREDIVALADQVVHIPMHGIKESLNVSVAAGIALYEISERLQAG